MLFEGKYSHAVIKKAKAGDYRVQDDFGGSVQEYIASAAEKDFAEKVVSVQLRGKDKFFLYWNIVTGLEKPPDLKPCQKAKCLET